MTHKELITQLSGEICQSLTDGRWESFVGDFDTLAEEVVSALIAGRDDDLTSAYQQVERAYTHALVSQGIVNTPANGHTVAGELEAFTRLLAVAQHHQRPPRQAELLAQSKYVELLRALEVAPQGLSGKELSGRTRQGVEEVARRLPLLRSAGLVQSVRVGKSIMNTLTENARQRLLAERGPPPKDAARKTLTAEASIARFQPIEDLQGKITNAFARLVRRALRHEAQVAEPPAFHIPKRPPSGNEALESLEKLQKISENAEQREQAAQQEGRI